MRSAGWERNKSRSHEGTNIPIAKPCVYTSTGFFTEEFHVSHWSDQKFAAWPCTIFNYPIDDIGLRVPAHGDPWAEGTGPVPARNQRTKAGSAPRGRRASDRRRSLRHSKEEGRAAPASAPGKTEKNRRHARLLHQGGRAACECGRSGHHQRRAIHPRPEEGQLPCDGRW